MASVCCFVKPYFIGVPLNYYLRYNVRQKCNTILNPIKSLFPRNSCPNIRDVLKEILTYNFISPCTRRAFIQPVFTSSTLPRSFYENYVHRQQQSSAFHNITRSYCTSNRAPKFPRMMGFTDLPAICSPSFFNSIRNWVLSTFIIRMHLDKEFDLVEFSKAAGKAVELITARLSESDYSKLEGLLSDKLLAKIKATLSTCSLSQRQELSVQLKDVVFQYPYEIGIIMDENNDNDEPKRFVEITMCYHILKGYAEVLAKMAESGTSPLNFKFPESSEVYIVNCRFIREYTKGVEDQWTVNAFNFFLLSDLEEN